MQVTRVCVDRSGVQPGRFPHCQVLEVRQRRQWAGTCHAAADQLARTMKTD